MRLAVLTVSPGTETNYYVNIKKYFQNMKNITEITMRYTFGLRVLVQGVAVIRSSPNIQNTKKELPSSTNFLWRIPTTLATTGPQWKPALIVKYGPPCCSGITGTLPAASIAAIANRATLAA